MNRDKIQELFEQKNSPSRKPLIIRGARQVGKTWLMKEFGNSHYAQTAYINFEKNKRLHSLFEDDFDIQRIIVALQAETGLIIKAENTLIILDEIQEVPSALTEQYVAQTFLSLNKFQVYYWTSERARAEVDFLLQYKDQVYPVEVKAEENLQAKSLKVYKNKFNPTLSLRTSMSDFRRQDWLVNLPLYSISEILEIL